MQQQSQKNGSPGKAPHHGGKAWTLEKRPCSGHARHNPMELTPCMHPKVAPRMRAASAPPPPPLQLCPPPGRTQLVRASRSPCLPPQRSGGPLGRVALRARGECLGIDPGLAPQPGEGQGGVRRDHGVLLHPADAVRLVRLLGEGRALCPAAAPDRADVESAQTWPSPGSNVAELRCMGWPCSQHDVD